MMSGEQVDFYNLLYNKTGAKYVAKHKQLASHASYCFTVNLHIEIGTG